MARRRIRPRPTSCPPDLRAALGPWRGRLRRRHLMAHGLAGLALAAAFALPALVLDRWLVDPVARTAALTLAATALAAVAVRAWRTAPGWVEAARAADATGSLQEQVITALEPDPQAPPAFTALQRQRALAALRSADPRRLPAVPRRWERWAVVALVALTVDTALWLAPHPLAPLRAQRAQWRVELARMEKQVQAIQESLPATLSEPAEEPGAAGRPPAARPDGAARGPELSSPPRPAEPRQEQPGPGPEARPGTPAGGPQGGEPGGPAAGAGSSGLDEGLDKGLAGDLGGSAGGEGSPAGSPSDPAAALSRALAGLSQRLREARANPTATTLARAAAAAQRAGDAARAAGGSGASYGAGLQGLIDRLSGLATGLQELARLAAGLDLALGRAGPGGSAPSPGQVMVPFPGPAGGLIPPLPSGPPPGSGVPPGADGLGPGAQGSAGGSPWASTGGAGGTGTGAGAAVGGSGAGPSAGSTGSGSGTGAGAGAGMGPGAGTGAGTGLRSGGGQGAGNGSAGQARGAGGQGWGRGSAGSPLAGGLGSRLAGGEARWLPGAQAPGSLTLPGWSAEPITVQPGQAVPAQELQGRWASQAALDLGSGELSGLPPELQWLIQAYFGGGETNGGPGTGGGTGRSPGSTGNGGEAGGSAGR